MLICSTLYKTSQILTMKVFAGHFILLNFSQLFLQPFCFDYSPSVFSGGQKNASRQSRIWPFIIPYWRLTVVPKTACINENQNGICLSKARCINSKGSPTGTCQNARGVCCIYIRSCGSSTNSQITYFRNPSFPSPDSSGNRCELTINKSNDNICQIKIDFIHFSLAQPDELGVCKDDFFLMSEPTVPLICGENSGQTVYIDFNSQCIFHKISLVTSNSISMDRLWNLKITQLSCNSTLKAPKGCLMYFNKNSGTVSSFNYGTTSPTNQDIWTRQMNNLNYGICVEAAPDFCEIEWSQSSNSMYTFTISDNTIDANPGESSESLSGEMCDHNYIVIPSPYREDNQLTFDRFCGNAFITTRTKSQPFVLTVVMNNQEGDYGNRGFQLNFRQIPCKP